MIADILIYISVICVFLSLIPACISDYKTRKVDPNIWKYAAYIGLPISIIAFILKLINNEIVLPSLILSIAFVLIAIIITIILANVRDPLYNPKQCERCGTALTTKSDAIKCPKCEHVNAKAILGGADMIALDIIFMTSFYFSQDFIPLFMFGFTLASIKTMIVIKLKTKNLTNYRVPLIIPITIGYILTLIFIVIGVNPITTILLLSQG